MKWAGRERQWGEDVAEADERDSGAGSEGSDGKMNAWGGARPAMEVETAGETRKSLFL